MNLLLRFSRVSVYSFWLFMPWLGVVVGPLNGHDAARVAEILLMSICAVACAAKAFIGNSISGASPRVALSALLFAGLCVISIVHAPVSYWAWREASLYAGMLAIGYVMAQEAIPSQRLIDGWVVNAAVAMYGTLLLITYLSCVVTRQPINFSNLYFGYQNDRFYDHVATVAWPITVAAFATGSSASNRRLLFYGTAVCAFWVLVSGGRSTVLSLCASYLLLRYVAPTSTRNLSRPALFSLLVAVIAYAALVTLPSHAWPELFYVERGIAKVGETSSSHSRWALWLQATNIFLQSPWLGAGPMHFAHYPIDTVDAAHPHNIYIQLISEWGVFVAIPSFYFGSVFLWQLIKRLRLPVASENTLEFGTGLVWAVLASGLDGLLSGNFVMPVSQVWIASTYGLAYAWMKRSQQSIERTGSGHSYAGRSMAVLWTSVFVLSFWSMLTTKHETIELDQILQASGRTRVNYSPNPRFWSDGWF